MRNMERSHFLRLMAATPFAAFLPKRPPGMADVSGVGTRYDVLGLPETFARAIKNVVEPDMGYCPKWAECAKLPDVEIDIRGGGALETGYAEKYLIQIMDDRGVVHQNTLLMSHGIKASSDSYKSELAYNIHKCVKKLGRDISMKNKEGPYYIRYPWIMA